MVNSFTADLESARPINRVEHTVCSAVVDLPSISAERLANINFGIFRSLRSLGTEQERICAAMGLSVKEYECLLEMS